MAATDDFAQTVTGGDSPFRNAAAITPSDTTTFTNVSRGIYVGVTGDVTAVVNGSAVLFKAVPAGTVLRIAASRVNSSATTATNMVALW